MVEPEARGRGLARSLLTELCPADGASWLVTHSEAPAVGLYHRLGWRCIGSGTTSTGIPLDYFLLDPRNGGGAPTAEDRSGAVPISSVNHFAAGGISPGR